MILPPYAPHRFGLVVGLAGAKGNKRGPLRKAGKGKLIGVHVMPSLLASIDEWASKRVGGVSRPDAMRRLIERGLSPGRA